MKALLGFMLMLVASSACAAWVKIDETDTSVIYADPATIRKNGDLRRVWQVTNLNERHPDGEMSRRTLFEYNCKDEQFRLLSWSTHSGSMTDGRVIASSSDITKWQFVAPGTVGEAMLKFVCVK